MITLRKLYVRQNAFPKDRIASIDRAHKLEELYSFGKLKVEYDTRIIPDFLSDAVLENEDNLDEDWIQRKIGDLRYHIVHVDMEPEEWDELGLRSTLYGQSQVVTTQFGRQAISYGRWYEDLDTHVRKMPDHLQPITPLTLGIWHEDTHSISHLTRVRDWTHVHFYGMLNGERWKRQPTPELAWMQLPFDKLATVTQLDQSWRSFWFAILQQLQKRLDALSGEKTEQPLLHPVDAYKNVITQGYGVANRVYSLTGHHIGTDYGCPIGTPVRAPQDGKATVVGESNALGFFCYYEYRHKGRLFVERFMHMRESVKAGEYKRGQIIGYTGNTGFSTGPHFHHDIWPDQIQMEKINRNNFRQLTVNPQVHYAQ